MTIGGSVIFENLIDPLYDAGFELRMSFLFTSFSFASSLSKLSIKSKL